MATKQNGNQMEADGAYGEGGGKGGGVRDGVLAEYLDKTQLDGLKKGKKVKWTKRWFVLEGSVFSYYDTHKAKQCKGSWDLAHKGSDGAAAAAAAVGGGGEIKSDFETLQFEIRTPDFARAFRARSKASFRKWVTALYRQMSTGVFGKPILSLQEAPFLNDWYAYLTQFGLHTEGIFRVSGQHAFIETLKTRYNRGELSIDLQEEVGQEDHGVHIVADLLKSWLRKLPLLLVSSEMVDTLVDDSLGADALESGALRDVFRKMVMDPNITPPISAAVLHQLFRFLKVVAEHSDTNKMTTKNLALCFTPSLCHLTSDRMATAPQVTYNKLAECLAKVIEDLDGWLPMSEEQLKALGARPAPRAVPAAAPTAGGHGNNGNNKAQPAQPAQPAPGPKATPKATPTRLPPRDADVSPSYGPADDDVGHVREESDLTKLVNSAKTVNLNASPLGPIELDDSKSSDKSRRSSGSSRSKQKPKPTARALEDARAMRQKLIDAGWVSKKARDGRTFFYHRKERRSSWSADGLVACWIRVKSSTTGKPYFYHSITKESKWRLGKDDLTFEHLFAREP